MRIQSMPMRVVTLEEHFVVPALIQKSGIAAGYEHSLKPEIRAALGDLGEKRLRAMDEGEITVQVLSAASPGADLIDGQAGIDFARGTNDALADAVRQHPQRYAGFAHLPMRSPEAAADELERAVSHLGFRGALINGTTQGFFLDDERFAPILARAEQLDVPIYIHPALPPAPVQEAYYGRLPENRGLLLSMAGFGWHIEVGIHVLRMVLAGTFERYPRLKVVIGHMGEALPFMLDRSEQVFQQQANPVAIKETILKHVWLTTSGFFTLPPFINALLTFGADRILFSIDYPFSPNPQGLDFLMSLPVSEHDRAKIAHGNADQLFRLGS
jgi:predicted TIM-barrel fold metal-dependent hydrolase